jgi:hypothetical protein
MIPLYIFLLIWFVLLAIFGFMALLSVIQMLRYGLAGVGTYLTTTAFFLATFLVIVGTSAFLVSVDWQQNIDLLGDGTQSSILLNQ